MPPTPTAAQVRHSHQISRLISDVAPGVTVERERTLLESRVASGLRADVGESRKEWFERRVTLQGLADKARIRVQDDLADSIELLVQSLDGQGAKLGHEMRDDDDKELQITKSNLPLHVQFLLSLADQPDQHTHIYAHSILHPLPQEETEDQRLYREIMQEPFEGAHWASNKEKELGRDEDWELSDDEASSSNSSDSQEIRTPVSVRRVQSVPEWAVDNGIRVQRRNELVQEIKARSDGAYWKTGGSLSPSVDTNDLPQGWEALSTFPNFNILLQDPNRVKTIKIITMYEMLREALMALSGKTCIVFTTESDGACTVRQDGPSVAEYTPTSLQSQLARLATTATAAGRLRHFVTTTSSDCLSTSKQLRSSGSFKTIQAFAEAVNDCLQGFDTWLAAIEEASLPGTASSSASPVIVTLTSLQRDLDLFYAPLVVVLDDLLEYNLSPHTLLNHLYGLLISLSLRSPISSTVSTIFIATATPLWSLIGGWLTSGMPIPAALSSGLESSLDVISAAEAEREAPIDREFFITRDHDVSWADEDFWSSGFVVQPDEWPAWLPMDVREGILEAGKAMGLLRVLETDLDLDAWPSLSELIGSASLDHRKLPVASPTTSLAVLEVTPSEMAVVLGGFLTPRIQLVQRTLRQTMAEDCAMAVHLAAIEDILYARDGVVMHEWATWLFTRMRQNQSWTSFQLLNSAFRDAITDYSSSMINPSIIRLQFTGKQTTQPGVRDLSKLVVDYEVPFPLSLQFTPTSMRLRSEVFAVLLQLRYSRHLLLEMVYNEQCRSRNATSTQQQVLRLRQKLLWFVQTIWTFLMESVLEPKLFDYHHKIQGLTSMEDLISAELEFTRSIRDFCFNHPDAERTHSDLITILEMAQDLALSEFQDQLSGTDGPVLEQQLNTLVTDFSAGVEILALEAPPDVSRMWRMLSYALESWVCS